MFVFDVSFPVLCVSLTVILTFWGLFINKKQQKRKQNKLSLFFLTFFPYFCVLEMSFLFDYESNKQPRKGKNNDNWLEKDSSCMMTTILISVILSLPSSFFPVFFAIFFHFLCFSHILSTVRGDPCRMTMTCWVVFLCLCPNYVLMCLGLCPPSLFILLAKLSNWD